MRTNIVIDDDKMKLAMALSGLKTKRETVDRALQAYIDKLSRKNMIDLKCKIKFADDYDYKSMRGSI
ncbi:MAG: type II toxin-antitoxin system VapB family antitoxin [Coriobacteriia bacterium]|nr:type II toxin-antitoxin system VapB family antitoxin [Coriobacteriia bacterium]